MRNLFLNILLLITLSFFSCKNLNDVVSNSTTNNSKNLTYKLTNNKVSAEGVYFFSTEKNIITTWTEHSKVNVLKFAFFNKKSNTFKNTKEVLPALGLQAHAESMAKIGMDKNGYLYAIYRRKSTNPNNRFGGLIYYCISKDNGNTWTNEQQITSDKNATSQSFYDIEILPDGNLGIIWLDNRKPIDKNHRGKTIFFTKTNSGKGLQKEKAIAGSTCECCRTDLFVDKQNNINIAYRNLTDIYESNFDGKGNIEIRDMYYITSNDNGKTFSNPTTVSQDNWHINGCPHTGPSMASIHDKLATVWFTAANDKPGIYFNTRTNNIFSKRKLLTKNGMHPQIISLSSKFFITYDEYYELLEKGYSKIILEIIDDFSRKTIEISRKNSNNNHPVITAINNTTILISWVNDDLRNSKIEYKIIKI